MKPRRQERNWTGRYLLANLAMVALVLAILAVWVAPVDAAPLRR